MKEELVLLVPIQTKTGPSSPNHKHAGETNAQETNTMSHRMRASEQGIHALSRGCYAFVHIRTKTGPASLNHKHAGEITAQDTNTISLNELLQKAYMRLTENTILLCTLGRKLALHLCTTLVSVLFS